MNLSNTPFDLFTKEYEDWFRNNPLILESELMILKQIIPTNKKGIEIGVGTGLFASKLNINYGIDPSYKMLELAKSRNIEVKFGTAENIPFPDNSFDFAIMITTLCFIENPQKAIEEITRILTKNGEIIIAIIDKNSVLGKRIEHNKKESKFYNNARLYSTEDVLELLKNNNYKITQICQTLINQDNNKIETPIPGHGKGGFIVVKGKINNY